MSTNFYAQRQITENLTERLHIGKRSGSGISTFQGAVFPTVEAWRTFLTHNIASVTIFSEYGEVVHVDDFFRDEVDSAPDASRQQIQWLRDNVYPIHDTPIPLQPGRSAYWLDGNRLFSNADFC